MEIEKFEKLQYFLENTPIPSVNKVPLTYFDIWSYSHYENLWSNVYAFFFNPKEEHNLGELFATTLTELINEKTDEKFVFNSSDIEVKTEFYTDNKGRIDLCLSNEEEAIIIENKVYHTVNNDFDDYYNSIRQENKCGVILTLHKLNKEEINEKFVGITHSEFIERVIRNLSPYFSKANEKYLILLKDFQQNIINKTGIMEDNKEAVEFYWKNFKEIKQIEETKESFKRFIKDEVPKIIDYFNNKGIKFYDLKTEYGDSKTDLIIGIDCQNLLTSKGKTIELFIEVRGVSVNRKDEFKNLQESKLSDEEKSLIDKNFYTYESSRIDFTIHKPVEIDDIFNISDIIENSPILSIYKKIKAEFNIQ